MLNQINLRQLIALLPDGQRLNLRHGQISPLLGDRPANTTVEHRKPMVILLSS